MKKNLGILLAGLIGLVHADANSLNEYLANSKTVKADFSQTITMGKKTRTTSGSMEIARPNKFRWEYTKEQQLIISDAKDIYIYDKPLQQVTVKALGDAIDKSPAALLAGANNVQNLYKVTDVPSNGDGLTWFKIEPKTKNDNNGFQVVMMGFDSSHKIAAMQFIDTFGNKTNLKFTNVQTGVNLPATDFNFTPPAGVDVLQQ